MNYWSKYVVVFIAVCAVAACGGYAVRPTTPNVLVHAGQNIEVNAQVTVSVDGISTSSAGVSTYAWTSPPTSTLQHSYL